MSSLPVDGPSGDIEIDIKKLNRRLAELPVEQIRRRRARMNTFYEEVLVSADPDRGISFNTLLMILAHYKVISDNKSLKLEEFLRRRARLQRVEEAVNRNIVVGFFDTLYWARRFRRIKDGKKNARITEFSHFGVPEIFVHDEGDESVGVQPQETPQTPITRLDVPALSITPVDDPSDPFEDRFGASFPRGSMDAGSHSSASASGSNAKPQSQPLNPDLRARHDVEKERQPLDPTHRYTRQLLSPGPATPAISIHQQHSTRLALCRRHGERGLAAT